jgi:hypothetical protein
MSTSAPNHIARKRVSLRKINRFALLGVCLLALSALLFYGPVLFLMLRG